MMNFNSYVWCFSENSFWISSSDHRLFEWCYNILADVEGDICILLGHYADHKRYRYFKWCETLKLHNAIEWGFNTIVVTEETEVKLCNVYVIEELLRWWVDHTYSVVSTLIEVIWRWLIFFHFNMINWVDGKLIKEELERM
jgi:hypothetical protein